VGSFLDDAAQYPVLELHLMKRAEGMKVVRPECGPDITSILNDDGASTMTMIGP
jgi:hypothetical protein